MIYCQKCGAQNADNAQFCVGCGTPFAQQQPNGASQQQYMYQQQQQSNGNVPAQPGKGLAIASMVCGIVSFFCFGVILGILALIFGGIAKSKGYKGGMATAGVVLGVIGLAIYVLGLIFWSEALFFFM